MRNSTDKSSTSQVYNGGSNGYVVPGPKVVSYLPAGDRVVAARQGEAKLVTNKL